MSRLAKKPILIPDKVEVKVDGNLILIKGPLGQGEVDLTRFVDGEIKKDNNSGSEAIFLNKSNNSSRAKAMVGTVYSLTSNLVTGVSKGHSKTLVFNGVGYQAQANNNKLTLKVGFSHDVEIEAPNEVKFEVNKNEITVTSQDKQLVGQYAAKIREVRPVDPYVLKGIKYKGEQITQKEGKTVEKMGEEA